MDPKEAKAAYEFGKQAAAEDKASEQAEQATAAAEKVSDVINDYRTEIYYAGKIGAPIEEAYDGKIGNKEMALYDAGREDGGSYGQTEVTVQKPRGEFTGHSDSVSRRQSTMQEFWTKFAAVTGVDVERVSSIAVKYKDGSVNENAASGRFVADMLKIIISEKAVSERRTGGHEIGELIFALSGEDFDAIGDVLISHYVETHSMAELNERIVEAQAKNQKVHPTSYADAKKEVICDLLGELIDVEQNFASLENWLNQSNMSANKKRAFRESLKSLVQKLIDFLKSLANGESREERQARRQPSREIQTVIQALENVRERIEGLTDGEKITIRGREGSGRYSFQNTTTGMANDQLLPYDEELKHLIESKGGYIVDSYDKLIDLVNRAFDKPNEKATAYFGILSPAILSKIEKSVPNLPRELNGTLFKPGRTYSVAATLDSIQHIPEDKKNITRADVVDYLDRFADTIIDFDTTAFDYYYEKGQRINGVIFKKMFEDGTMISFDLVSSSQKSIKLQTIYMEKSDYIKKKSAETPLMQNAPANAQGEVGQISAKSAETPLMQKTSAHTPVAKVGQTSSNPKISQKDSGVNSYSMQKSENNSYDGENSLLETVDEEELQKARKEDQKHTDEALNRQRLSEMAGKGKSLAEVKQTAKEMGVPLSSVSKLYRDGKRAMADSLSSDARMSYDKTGTDVAAQNTWLQMYDAGYQGTAVDSFNTEALDPKEAKAAYEFGKQAAAEDKASEQQAEMEYADEGYNDYGDDAVAQSGQRTIENAKPSARETVYQKYNNGDTQFDTAFNTVYSTGLQQGNAKGKKSDFDFNIFDDPLYPKTEAERSVFNRSMANKTSYLQEGETADIMIFTADSCYFIHASGYLQGEIKKIEPLSANEKKINILKKEARNGTYGDGEGTDSLFEAIRSNRRRYYRDMSSTKRRKTTKTNVVLDGGQSERHDGRDEESSIQDRRDLNVATKLDDEYHKIVSSLFDNSVNGSQKKADEAYQKLDDLVRRAAAAAGYTEVWYHGTNEDWNEYDLSKNNPMHAQYGEWIYLAKSPSSARMYGDIVKKLYVKPGLSYREAKKSGGTKGHLSAKKDGREIGVMVVYNPSQIKSADMIVRDDDGRIIPLSERFDTAKTDIRYSLDTVATAEEIEAAKSQDRLKMEQALGKHTAEMDELARETGRIEPGSFPWAAFVVALREIGNGGNLNFETFAQVKAERLPEALVPEFLRHSTPWASISAPKYKNSKTGTTDGRACFQIVKKVVAPQRRNEIKK